MSTFSVKVDLAAFDADMNVFAYTADEAARPAAQAAAQVLYDEVRRNVAKIKPKTGNLSRAIYQAYSKDNSAQGRATYHVSWNAKKAPHGHLVEFGHLQRYEVTHDPKTGRFITHKDRPLATPKQIPARPFLRPAMVKAQAALDAAEDEFLRRVHLKS